MKINIYSSEKKKPSVMTFVGRLENFAIYVSEESKDSTIIELINKQSGPKMLSH